MNLNLTNLLKGHYSTEQNGLLVKDTEFVKWSHDGYGYISADIDVKALLKALKDADKEERE